jgi:AraC family transcriptional regulator, dual regulator of chb operon
VEAIKLLARDILEPETGINYNFISHIDSAYGLHYHDYYEIFLILNGNAIHFVNGIEQYLCEGSMVFIRPEDVHQYKRHASGDCQFINIAFPLDSLNDLFNYLGDGFPSEMLLSGSMPPTVLLSSSEKSMARSKLEGLVSMPQYDKKQLKTRLKMLIADFISNYFALYDPKKKLTPHWLENLVSEMEKVKNFKEGLPRMQKLSNKSQEHLSRTFKEYTGKTPTDFINELRLNYAVNMLVHSDTHVLDIAFDSGFNNLSHFYHLFKKQYHIPPSLFRKYNHKNPTLG